MDGSGRRCCVSSGRDAIGFDNNSSTELLVPGISPSTGWTFDSADRWERDIPEATALSYR